MGVSAIVPARGGDAVRVLLAKRSIERSSYATVAASVVLLTTFDFVVASALVLWAAFAGLLPGLHALGPSFDFRWAVDHVGTVVKVIGVVAAVAVVALLWFAEDLAGFRHRLAQGFAILKDRRAYLRYVALWQGADWVLRLAAVFFFLHAFGLPATLHNALLVQVTAALASLIPLTPQGIGTEQAFLISIFRGQAPSSTLLAFSVGMRITLMVVNAILGFATLFVTLRTVRLRALREHASSAP